MGFILDGLDAEAYDRTYTDGQLVRRIVGYFGKQRRGILLAAGMVLASAILDAGMPIIISAALDRASAGVAFSELALLAAGVIALGVCSWLCTLVKQTEAAKAVGDVVLALRQDAAEAVFKRDMSFYDQFASGKIVSRVASDTAAFSQVIILTMDVIGRLALVLVIVGYLLTVNWRLALILVVLTPIIIGVALGFRAIARASITRSRRMNAVVNAHVQETISGIGVAKTFRQEHAVHTEFLSVNTTARQVSMRVRYVFSSIFPLLNILVGWSMVALIALGVAQVQQGAVTAGELFLFVQGLLLFSFPLTSIASFWSQFQIGLAAGERVFALIDSEPRVVQTAHEPVPTLRGAVDFERVWFSYAAPPPEGSEHAIIAAQTRAIATDLPPALHQSTRNGETNAAPDTLLASHRSTRNGEPSAGTELEPHQSTSTGESNAAPDPLPPAHGELNWVLRDFSLSIRAGETLALVGHTGSGKSSIVKLIARFYEFQQGQIRIDGQDIRSFDLAQYRSQLGIVTQTPFLFDGTVRDNIRYGKPDANDDEVLAAAQHVGGGDWLVTLPNGLDSPVGERGARLSMGQRQLVALARVLLQNPAIIIMDEATASIDPLTEALIQEGLDTLLAGRTAVVIAHRLNTVRHADRIIVLREGTILETGSHDQLLAQGGHYADLYNIYFRHQSLDYIEQAVVH